MPQFCKGLQLYIFFMNIFMNAFELSLNRYYWSWGFAPSLSFPPLPFILGGTDLIQRLRRKLPLLADYPCSVNTSSTGVLMPEIFASRAGKQLRPWEWRFKDKCPEGEEAGGFKIKLLTVTLGAKRSRGEQQGRCFRWRKGVDRGDKLGFPRVTSKEGWSVSIE